MQQAGLKLAQKFSLSLNVALTACLAVTVIAKRKPPPESTVPLVQPLTRAPAGKAEGPTATGSAPEVHPFRWSQIESADYRVYVANLRAIGCPEQTVRDIIRADVRSLYALNRRELQISGQGATGRWSQREESELIAMLLVQGAEQPVPRVERVTPTPAVVPLVLRPVDMATLGLSDDQKAAVEEVRNQFITDIGGVEQDPYDPAYAGRWQKAQPQSDMMLRGMIGVSAFMRYQLEAGD